MGLDFVIAHLMLTEPAPFFVQIGANDGISNDPLHKFVTRFGWKGILLEPVPSIFAILERTYKNYPNVKLINAALAERDGRRTMYTVRVDDSTSPGASQLSSLKREQLLKHQESITDVSSRIEEQVVECISFATLLQQAETAKVDLLQIDAEGYDFAILNLIDFKQTRPSIIAYEHAHMSKEEEEETAAKLVGEGYQLARGQLDTVAYHVLNRSGLD
jgi:FkbM family methyltransferase